MFREGTLANWLTQKLITDLGVDQLYAIYIRTALFFIGLLIISLILWWVGKKLFNLIIPIITSKTKTIWDDIIFNPKVINSFSHLIPAILIYLYSPVVFKNVPSANALVVALSDIFIVIVSAEIFGSFFNSMREILLDNEKFKDKPIGSFTQMAKMLVYIIAGVLIISIAINKSPIYLLSGLGAMAAVLILVFKDSILGLVASIQLSANDMVRVGDWVTMPKYGADGDVLTINLTSIRVQNFDKTFTNIPTYAFISDSFTNWRGMENSAGRRIKRALYIKIDTIKFCDQAMLNKFREIELLGEGIDVLSKDVEEHNTRNKIDKSNLINGRNLTNIGLFRVYIKEYLKNNPNINQNMTQMVRQRPSTEHGLPLEIYAFCKDKRWVNYEGIMADIFDHLFAAARDFDLEIYESPASSDIRGLKLN